MKLRSTLAFAFKKKAASANGADLLSLSDTSEDKITLYLLHSE